MKMRIRRDLDVDGAIEAEVRRVTFDGGDLGRTVEQTVVLVRTVEWIDDLRDLGLASVTDGSIAGTLPDTVSLGRSRQGGCASTSACHDDPSATTAAPVRGPHEMPLAPGSP
jgi:hypothetical protein